MGIEKISATIRMASDKIDALKTQILALSKEVVGDEENRTKFLGVVMMAVAVVETPLETIWRLMMSVSVTIIDHKDEADHRSLMLRLHS